MDIRPGRGRRGARGARRGHPHGTRRPDRLGGRPGDGGRHRCDGTRGGRRLVARAVETYGRLDAAFNNAGEGALQGSLADVAPEDFDRVLDVHLRGTFLCLRSEIPAMLESGGGSIVNMTSTAGVSGWRGLGAYVAAKHGVVGLTRSAALDYAAQGIRINAVAPGPIMNDRIASLAEEQREPIAQAVPMQRIGTCGVHLFRSLR